jgi:rhodanese-related sulfurtransferase
MPQLTPSAVAVTEIPAADSELARTHFHNLLRFETDCWDVHASLELPDRGFVLLDVRSPALYTAGHVATAVNLPHRVISERTLAGYAADTLFVVYCAGPHCNGADKAALRLSELGRSVKKMLGGIEGWTDEGFPLVTG